MTLKEEIVLVAPSMLWHGVSGASRGRREWTSDGASGHLSPPTAYNNRA